MPACCLIQYNISLAMCFFLKVLGTLSDKMLYEDLTDLKKNGLFISQQSYDYFTQTSRLSLPCLYFTQFANFACLSVHYLAFSKDAEHKHFYKNLSNARDECWRGLTRSWKLMVTRLDISAEERLALIENCVGKIILKVY